MHMLRGWLRQSPFLSEVDNRPSNFGYDKCIWRFFFRRSSAVRVSAPASGQKFGFQRVWPKRQFFVKKLGGTFNSQTSKHRTPGAENLCAVRSR